MKKNKINKELEDLSPFLSQLKKDKKEGFSMPANYFDTFENRLMHRIEEEAALSPSSSSQKETTFQFFKTIKAFFSPRYAIGFSTCLILIIGSVYVLKPVESTTNIDVMEGLLADGSIDAYIYNNIEDFKTEDIVAFLDEDEVIDIQEDIIGEELPVSNNFSLGKSTEAAKSSMDKAMEVVVIDDLLDDLTEEDLELNEDDLF
jgi:hypothetical protein